jgi:hypothetical protein
MRRERSKGMGIEELELNKKYDMVLPTLGEPIKRDRAFETYMAEPVTFKKSGWFNPFMSVESYQPLYVPWHRGHITELRYTGNDIISGPFSGCYFVMYKRDGDVYVGHIDTKNENETKETWKAFYYKTKRDPRENQIFFAFDPMACTGGSVASKFPGMFLFYYAIITKESWCYYVPLLIDSTGKTIVIIEKRREYYPMNADTLARVLGIETSPRESSVPSGT